MGVLKLEKTTQSRIILVIQTVFIMCWLSVLSDTDARHSVYSLCAILSVFCLGDNYRHQRLFPGKHGISCLLLSAVFSVAVALANYPVFLQVRDPLYVSASTNLMQNALNLVCSLIGGTCVAFNLLTVLVSRFPLAREKSPRTHGGRLFWFVFVSVVLIDCVYLFLDEFPGHVTPDSLDQILQGYRGVYSNDHPFWHTWSIRVLLSVGYAVFGSPNGAVAFFSLCQILLLAGCFAYTLLSLYQAGIPKWCIGLVYAVYALLPYNIAMSITMWKDVPFSAACLVFGMTLLRILNGMDKKKWVPCLLLGISGAVLCLCRNGGLLVALVTLILALPRLLKKNKAAVCVLAVVLVVCVLLTGPVLTAMGVAGTDVTEALSIPLQQLARVVADGCPLTQEETALLSRIFDLEEIPSLYTNWLADPIKLEVRENDVVYFRENLGIYGKLWVQLGLKHPDAYLKAWVDQTKGYWNGGYDYHQYVEMMEENSFGMAKTAGNNIVAKLIYLYFGLTRHAVFMEPQLSIGLQVWILAACCYLNLVKKRGEYLLAVPALGVILGLLFGTPVYAEFRYAYAAFLLCPVVLPLTLYGEN